ncbi:AzlD domain-containing protein [Serratia odorifera]|uniref:Branched-chain amino acid transport protein (AzlD) n=2 Tax=Serratia odorifera TaxID=618 RepID=D4E932_SEROD|nr:AzlD domain-containing protein [Serratia odorifera]EFE93798.1 Branched-chain amino acid transport protein (AzlD) [Serratia odorifera DSM 4582]VDZ65433.1 Predicted membrane protein [Serratia odorifera]
MMVWLIIVLMALVVFFNRYFFLAPSLRLRLSARMHTLLGFSVPAVLSAICGPIVMYSDDRWRGVAENPYLWGALFAVILAFFLRNMLLVVLFSMLIFITLRGMM